VVFFIHCVVRGMIGLAIAKVIKAGRMSTGNFK
jgi:hypothetical protein